MSEMCVKCTGAKGSKHRKCRTCPLTFCNRCFFSSKHGLCPDCKTVYGKLYFNLR